MWGKYSANGTREEPDHAVSARWAVGPGRPDPVPPGDTPDVLHPYVQAYPYVVFGVGVVMAWYFNRSRIVFALLILAAARFGA